MSNVINNMARFGFLEVRSGRQADRHVIALSGELDMDGADRVTQELRQAEATDARQVVLDLSALDFIDSSGIQLILEADARSRANGHRLRLVQGPAPVRRVFAMTALLEELPFVT
jgi:stage II sporulation protein AA (anti-sigma F factor antagonist)